MAAQDRHEPAPAEHPGAGPVAAPGTGFPGVDLDMLAYDIADMLTRCEYPIDAADCHIRPALPAFLAAILGNAAGDTGTEG